MPRRFWSKVNFSGSCWLWTGHRGPTGHGRFRVEPHTESAHRIAFQLSSEERIPPGMAVCHRCDNPPCVRPSHLFLGTPSDNIREMHRKGRAIWASKLSRIQILLLQALGAVGLRNDSLALLFGLSEARCSTLRRGQTRFPLRDMEGNAFPIARKRRRPCILCNRSRHGHGYCESHYYLFRRYGYPERVNNILSSVFL